MKNSLILFAFLLTLIACSGNAKHDEETFNCSGGKMTAAWYEQGLPQSIPPNMGTDHAFMMVVDTHYKALNFISWREHYLRKEILEGNMANMDFKSGLDTMSAQQALTLWDKERISLTRKADAVHLSNNQGQQQVWVLNYSKDTVATQMQDGSFIAIMQAKNKSGEWRPIQYWGLSTCGNSYEWQYFPPNTANSFLFDTPDEGDFETELRFKLLGADKFYYSNQFPGRIDYCAFVEDTINIDSSWRNKVPRFKLDTLLQLGIPLVFIN